MTSLLLTLLPLGLGVFLSPEIIMPGLWLAGSEKKPLLKAWLFFVGGVIGISFLLTLGFILHAKTQHSPSWTRFAIQATLGTLLFIAALHAFFKKKEGPEKVENPRFAHAASPPVALALGFLVTGLNLKVASLVITAGHHVALSPLPFEDRMFGLLLFSVLCLLPVTIPALAETMRPGSIRTLMEPCNRFLKKYGRWTVVFICLYFGFNLWKHALAVLP